MPEPVLYELRRDAAWITLNQPEKRNALSDEIIAGLLERLRSALADDRVRVIVLTGAGSAFCAGADLKSGGMPSGDASLENPFVSVMKTIWNAPKPVVARVNGPAFGGGVGLVAACDIAVAADSVTFSFSEVRVGVIPAMISVVVIPKLGAHQTMYLFLTGERFSAERAVEIGLIHKAVPADRLDEAIDEITGMIRLGGPNAIRAAKNLVRKVPTMSMDEAFGWTSQIIGPMFASEEAAEGMRAFLEKRKPKWVD
jgi:methylglutaconyl-CoA hydratase